MRWCALSVSLMFLAGCKTFFADKTSVLLRCTLPEGECNVECRYNADLNDPSALGLSDVLCVFGIDSSFPDRKIFGSAVLDTKIEFNDTYSTRYGSIAANTRGWSAGAVINLDGGAREVHLIYAALDFQLKEDLICYLKELESVKTMQLIPTSGYVVHMVDLADPHEFILSPCYIGKSSAFTGVYVYRLYLQGKPFPMDTLKK